MLGGVSFRAMVVLASLQPWWFCLWLNYSILDSSVQRMGFQKASGLFPLIPCFLQFFRGVGDELGYLCTKTWHEYDFFFPLKCDLNLLIFGQFEKHKSNWIWHFQIRFRSLTNVLLNWIHDFQPLSKTARVTFTVFLQQQTSQFSAADKNGRWEVTTTTIGIEDNDDGL